MSSGPRLIDMSPHTRQLMLKICDGDSRVPPILYQLYRYRRHHEMCQWIVDHRLIGPQLIAWLKNDFEGSPMKMAAFIISKLEHERKMRPVLIDRDYLPS